jgi:signal transduction histidine kinase
LRTQEISLNVDIDPAIEGLALSPEGRKELMLIIKEGLHNAVRHARCTSIALNIRREGRMLSLELHDNGRGMPVDRKRGGHGVANMRARAQALGGSFALDTAGDGTSLVIRVPVLSRATRATKTSS